MSSRRLELRALTLILLDNWHVIALDKDVHFVCDARRFSRRVRLGLRRRRRLRLRERRNVILRLGDLEG